MWTSAGRRPKVRTRDGFKSVPMPVSVARDSQMGNRFSNEQKKKKPFPESIDRKFLRARFRAFEHDSDVAEHENVAKTVREGGAENLRSVDPLPPTLKEFQVRINKSIIIIMVTDCFCTRSGDTFSDKPNCRAVVVVGFRSPDSCGNCQIRTQTKLVIITE